MAKIYQILIIATLAVISATTISRAHEVKAGDLLVTEMWTRATPNGAKVAGGYVTIENKGTAADRLIAASSPAAGNVEIHEMATTNGVMTMRPLEKGLPIEAGKSVTLAPGGLHLMLTALKQPLKEGEMLPITLQFEKTGKVDITLHIRGVGAKSVRDGVAKDGHSGMKM